jgi:medium-chain acyl-[acyl-carrier-protein] hydrolase
MCASGSTGVWFSCPATRPRATIQLFCFPYAGGSIFRGWSDALAPEVELWLAHLPGRERRISEPPLTSIGVIAQQASEALRHYAVRPFALFGHFMGALVAFEAAATRVTWPRRRRPA